MKNRMRELRTCGSVRGEGREVLTYSERNFFVGNAARSPGNAGDEATKAIHVAPGRHADGESSDI